MKLCLHLVPFLRYSSLNKCIGDHTKAAAHQSLNCIKTKKINKVGLWRKTIFNMADGIFTPCNVIRGCGMTCHWISRNVHHIGILHPVSISTTSTPSTCHSAPVSEIVSKSDHPRQKKQEALLSQRGRAMHSVCIASIQTSSAVFYY